MALMTMSAISSPAAGPQRKAMTAEAARDVKARQFRGIRYHRPQDGVARDHGDSGQVESHDARLGELLQGRDGERRV